MEKRILIAVTVGLLLLTGPAGAFAHPESPEEELAVLVHEIERVLPESWRVIESGSGELPIGWSGPETGLYVMVEDTGTRFFHPNGFHYYSFYRVWLMPPGWEGTMRQTPYIADSAPAFLLGLNSDRVALYHTAGGNVWREGPSAFCSALGLDKICYTDLTRRVVDLEIEEQLVDSNPATAKSSPTDDAFELNPYRILGLKGDGPGLYLEYVFGSEEDGDSQLDELTDRLAGSVFERFPEVESLYLRRCTRDTFTDTIVNRD